MCRIFDWVFDSVSVEQAPQNHFEDPNQFNQNEDEDDAHDTIVLTSLAFSHFLLQLIVRILQHLCE